MIILDIDIQIFIPEISHRKSYNHNQSPICPKQYLQRLTAARPAVLCSGCAMGRRGQQRGSPLAPWERCGKPDFSQDISWYIPFSHHPKNPNSNLECIYIYIHMIYIYMYIYIIWISCRYLVVSETSTSSQAERRRGEARRRCRSWRIWCGAGAWTQPGTRWRPGGGTGGWWWWMTLGDLVLDFLTYISGVFLGYFVVLLYFRYGDFLGLYINYIYNT